MKAQQTSPVAITGETDTHYVLRAISRSGQVSYGKWAKDSGPAPTSRELFEAWDVDTDGGRVRSPKWRRA